jgi:hypothetical protein
MRLTDNQEKIVRFLRRNPGGISTKVISGVCEWPLSHSLYRKLFPYYKAYCCLTRMEARGLVKRSYTGRALSWHLTKDREMRDRIEEEIVKRALKVKGGSS